MNQSRKPIGEFKIAASEQLLIAAQEGQSIDIGRELVASVIDIKG